MPVAGRVRGDCEKYWSVTVTEYVSLCTRKYTCRMGMCSVYHSGVCVCVCVCVTLTVKCASCWEDERGL